MIAMPYCENCGSQVSANAKFCGAVRTSPTQTQQPSQTPTKPQAAPKRERLNYYSPPDPRTIPSAPLPTAGAQPPSYQAPPRQAQPPSYQTPPAYAQAPVQPQPAPSAAPMQQSSGEVTIGVIHFRRMKSLGRYDSFAGVVTNQRMIFATLTSKMLSDAAMQGT